MGKRSLKGKMWDVPNKSHLILVEYWDGWWIIHVGPRPCTIQQSALKDGNVHVSSLGMGNISILSYTVILRAHIIVSWWFYNYRHIVFILLVVLLHKTRSKKISPKNKKDLGMGCHIPPLKKARNKGKCHYPASVPSH